MSQKVTMPQKESLTNEYKSDQKTISDNVIVEEVVALSNTDGGHLYIGVEDDGTITGAQEIHRNPIKLTALIANKTVPPVSVQVTLEPAEKPFIHIEVPKSRSIVATSSGKMLRRRLKADGLPESAPLYPHEITTRLSDLGRLDFSAQPVPGASLSDLDPLEIDRLRQLIQGSPSSDHTLFSLSDEELLLVLGLTSRIEDTQVPTLAGLLLVGREESLKSFVPTHEASFQVMQGTDIRANQTSRKPLLYVIDKMVELIDPWNPITEVQIGLISQPTPAFDRRAIREAIVNAFGHRDYSVLGSVRVLIDDGGLQIASPGGFIEGISVQNLMTAEPRSRNPRLMDALKRIGMAERTGRGIDRIYEGSLLYGRALPDYSDSSQNLVSLFISRSEPDIDFVRLLVEERERTGSQLSLQALLVLDTLKHHRRCSLDDFTQLVDIQQSKLKRTVELLCEADLIEASGTGRNRSYMLSSRIYKAKGETKEYIRQSNIDRIRYPEMIMKLAKSQGQITTIDVAELLRIPENKAYYEIRKLCTADRLESVKLGRGSYYRIKSQ